MAIKDILVHVDSTKQSDLRLKIGVELAQRNEAHLTGLHAKPYPYIPPISPDMGAVYYGELIDDQQKFIDQCAEAAKKKFDAAVRLAGISQEWREVTGDPSDVVHRQARYSDIVIVGQHNEDADRQAADLPDGVLLTTGRPTIIVPNNPNVKTFGRNIMVAWDDGIQATRAIHDALPLLQAAENVTVMAVNPKDTGDHGDAPCADICHHLARHGVKASAYPVTTDEFTTEHMILKRAFEHGSDLLVMGAYGHSRTREFVFGGVTAHVLENMELPVLMSH
jgi:nucleotide-binding universal stress UspA family protein